jgi:O-succinylbenzoic acid--CoA ligase
VLLATPADLPAALLRLDSDVVAPLGERALAAYRPDEPAEIAAGALVLTSGSTGTPRAVLLPAAAIRASVAATHARLGGPGDWVCALPVHHVAGFMTVARAVLSGTGLALVRPDLADLPAASGTGYLSLVPAQLHRALDDPDLRRRLAGYTILLGGQAMPPGLLERAADLRVVTTYGMAETCGGCVYDGVPLDGVRVVLDGERVSLGGPTVFAGYRLDPAGTAAVLDGDLVRTSDRGRWTDGRLQVVGRVDEVVVSGGVNVDLADLQRRADRACPGVVVLAVPDARWGQRVVAVTTADHGLAEVVAALAVPPAARPRELRRVPALAYTTTGKIDRGALARLWEEHDGDSG